MRTSFGFRSLALAALVAAVSGRAGAAPAFRFGPPLPDAAKAAGLAMTCIAPTGALRQAHPVLLVHGTALDAAESWNGTYERALPALGYETCSIDLPDHALGDIQTTSAPAIVAAIDRLRTRGSVNIVTHSQGGLDARVALAYWPEAAASTWALVELAPDNHGTVLADQVCGAPVKQGCTESVQQQQTTSRLIQALDAASSHAPAAAGVTTVFTRGDEVVPETGVRPTSSLDGASNIAVQDICPAANPRHIDMLVDPIAYAVVLDAFAHQGKADVSRIPKSVCDEKSVAAFDQKAATEIFIQSGNKAYRRFQRAPTVSTEPALAPYVTATPYSEPTLVPGQIP